MPRKRPITAKQIIFGQELAKVPSTPGASITSAHEKAYPDWNGLRKTRREAASRMAKNSNVLAIVERIRAQMPTPTLEEHIADLDEVRTKAIGAEQYSAAVKATEMQGRAAGLYIERSINEHVHRTADTDLHQTILDAISTDEAMLNAILEMALSKPELRDKAQLMLAEQETKQ